MKLNRERLERIKNNHYGGGVPYSQCCELIEHAKATIDQDSIPSRGDLASQIMAARYVNAGIGEYIDRNHASMFAAQSVIGADALRAELRKEQAK